MTTKCSMCGIEINSRNNVKGYCRKCYYKTPDFLAYQKEKQRYYYYNSEKNKATRKAYYSRPDIMAKLKIYRREYIRKKREMLKEKQNEKKL